MCLVEIRLIMETKDNLPDQNSEKDSEKKKQATEINKDDSVEITEEEINKFFSNKKKPQNLSDLFQDQKLASTYISGGVGFNDSGSTKIFGHVFGGNQYNYVFRHSDEIYSRTVAGHIFSVNKEKLLAVYTKPGLYQRAIQILKEQNILILSGQAHWGKATTAYHLLQSMEVIDILEIRQDVVPEDLLALEIEENFGYIIDTITPDSTNKIVNTIILNRLREHFCKKNCYLIITVDSRVGLPITDQSGYLLIWNQLPEVNHLIEKYLSQLISKQDDLTQALKLIDTDEVKSLDINRLLPGEVVHLAEILFRVFKKEILISDVLSCFESHVLSQIKEWFEEHSDIEKCAFMISLAVLNESSYNSVFDASNKLLFFINPNFGEEKKPIDIFSNLRSRRIKDSCAHLSSGFEETEFGKNPVEIVKFDNPLFQPTILQYMWKELDSLHKPLLGWLKQLAIDSDYEISKKVAVTIGKLNKYSFRDLKDEILVPWAQHDEKKVRASAAFSLGVSIWDGELESQILNLLHHWSTISNNWKLNWTAAVAYGGLVGLRYPDIALNELFSISKHEDLDLRLLTVLNRSVLNIFSMGQFESGYYLKVINTLMRWTSPEENKLVSLIGLFIFLDIAKEILKENNSVETRWLTVLWLSDCDDGCRDKIVTLWRRALNTKSIRKAALETLQNTLEQVEESAHMYPSIEKIILDIIHNGNDRERERVLYNIDYWQTVSGKKTVTFRKLNESIRRSQKRGEVC